MLDNDQRPGADARGADHLGAVRHRGIRIGRTAVTGWALAAVLVVAGFGTAMGATPAAVAQPVPVADTTDITDTTGTATAARLDPLSLLPTARPLNPAAVLPILPTIASVPDVATATQTAEPTIAAGTGGVVASVPAAQLRQAAFTTDAPDTRAAVAIRTALAQIGLPYVWGGNGPTNGDAGFDCSGLTTFSYSSAGVSLPRTAHTQYNAGPHVPDGAPLQPGDLVFYGTTARVHHVGMYLGAGRMVNAPTFGKPVQVAFYRYRGDGYLGATRPAAAAGSLTSGILPFVDPAQIPAVPQSSPLRIFTAPTAPMPAVLPQPGDSTLPPEQVTAAQAVAEGDAVAVSTAAARSAAVAGAATSTTAPVTTAPAATDPASTGTVTSPTAPAVPVTSTTTATGTTTGATTAAADPPVVTAPNTAASALTSTTTTTVAPPPVTTTTTSQKPATTTSTTTKKATTAPKATTTTPAAATTTTPTTTADDTTTAKVVKSTTEDDDTSTTKTTTKTTEKTADKAAEKVTTKTTESDDEESSSDSSDEEDD
jgi:cell wall-associated NlpC family hydrolase